MIKKTGIAIPIISVLVFIGVLGLTLSTTYHYVEVDVRLTERHENYAVYTRGTERESLEDVEVEQTFTMDFYTSQGDVMDVLEYVGECEVLVIDGETYIKISRLRSALDSAFR